MNEIRVNQLLGQMRAMAAESRGESPQAAEKTGFADTLGKALSSVNDIQTESGEVKKAFEMGDPNVSLVDVMVASQKANIAFQATVQVRNKFVQAYQDIMNMPI